MVSAALLHFSLHVDVDKEGGQPRRRGRRRVDVFGTRLYQGGRRGSRRHTAQERLHVVLFVLRLCPASSPGADDFGASCASPLSSSSPSPKGLTASLLQTHTFASPSCRRPNNVDDPPPVLPARFPLPASLRGLRVPPLRLRVRILTILSTGEAYNDGFA